MKNLITTIDECLVATKKHGQWMALSWYLPLPRAVRQVLQKVSRFLVTNRQAIKTIRNEA